MMVEPGSLRVLGILSNAAATIAEGEVLQLTVASDLATSEDIYLRVIRGKTAALFAAACEAGAALADADEARIAALRDYGDALGISFQIVDDLLDYGGSAAQMGKNTGDDFRERKLTLPLIKAVARADVGELKFWSRVIEEGKQNDADLAQAMGYLKRHNALEDTRQDALLWAEYAKNALLPLPENEIRQHLSDLADYVVSRVA